VHVDSDHDVDLLALPLVVGPDQEVSQVLHLLLLLLEFQFHGLLVPVTDFSERVFHPPGPPYRLRSNNYHAQVILQPVLPLELALIVDSLFAQLLQRIYHLEFHVVQPLLHFALGFDVFVELEGLVFF